MGPLAGFKVIFKFLTIKYLFLSIYLYMYIFYFTAVILNFGYYLSKRIFIITKRESLNFTLSLFWEHYILARMSCPVSVVYKVISSVIGQRAEQLLVSHIESIQTNLITKLLSVPQMGIHKVYIWKTVISYQKTIFHLSKPGQRIHSNQYLDLRPSLGLMYKYLPCIIFWSKGFRWVNPHE